MRKNSRTQWVQAGKNCEFDYKTYILTARCGIGLGASLETGYSVEEKYN